MNVYLEDKKQIKKFLCREPGPRPFIVYKFVDYSKKIVHGFSHMSRKSTHQLTDKMVGNMIRQQAAAAKNDRKVLEMQRNPRSAV